MSNQLEIELKDCAHCGGTAEIWVDNEKRDEHIIFTPERGGFDFDWYTVKCSKCGIETERRFVYLTAIEIWNTRPQSEPAAGQKDLIIKGDCEYCCGTGKEVDGVKTGKLAREMRIAVKGASLRKIAKLCGWSSTFQFDLETGRHRWTSERFKTFKQALESVRGAE